MKERKRLCLCQVQHRQVVLVTVVEDQVAPRLQLLAPGGAVGLEGEKRREGILPRPLILAHVYTAPPAGVRDGGEFLLYNTNSTNDAKLNV